LNLLVDHMGKTVIFFVAIVLIVAAGGVYWYIAQTKQTTTSATSTDSGIRGVVTLGPTCPVERIPPDPNCADKPYQTLVTIFRTSDPTHALLLVNSDASGKFSASLPPGEYTLGAGESKLPRCDHPQVTVEPHTFVSMIVSCDTGIR
jgi:hypothetical protein